MILVSTRADARATRDPRLYEREAPLGGRRVRPLLRRVLSVTPARRRAHLRPRERGGADRGAVGRPRRRAEVRDPTRRPTTGHHTASAAAIAADAGRARAVRRVRRGRVGGDDGGGDLDRGPSLQGLLRILPAALALPVRGRACYGYYRC